MDCVAVFITGTALSAAAGLIAVAYLRHHLKKTLAELCGTEERAAFWMAFSNLALLLTPLIFAMNYYPKGCEGASVFFEVTTQFKWGLVGLTVSVLALGAFIRGSIPREAGQKEQSTAD